MAAHLLWKRGRRDGRVVRFELLQPRRPKRQGSVPPGHGVSILTRIGPLASASPWPPKNQVSSSPTRRARASRLRGYARPAPPRARRAQAAPQRRRPLSRRQTDLPHALLSLKPSLPPRSRSPWSRSSLLGGDMDTDPEHLSEVPEPVVVWAAADAWCRRLLLLSNEARPSASGGLDQGLRICPIELRPRARRELRGRGPPPRAVHRF